MSQTCFDRKSMTDIEKDAWAAWFRHFMFQPVPHQMMMGSQPPTTAHAAGRADEVIWTFRESGVMPISPHA